MSSATSSSSSFVLFSKEDIDELKSRENKLVAQASSLEAAVNATEENLKQLKNKYAASQKCLQHLRSLITEASVESISVIAQSSDDEATNFNKLPSMRDAPAFIRAMLGMNFSDKVNMNTFVTQGQWCDDQSSDQYNPERLVICVVQLKGLTSKLLEIWYYAGKYVMKTSECIVWCNGRRYSYTTAGELKEAITSAIMVADKPIENESSDESSESE
jgi:FtsZ-binding cell division protein ZapB